MSAVQRLTYEIIGRLNTLAMRASWTQVSCGPMYVLILRRVSSTVRCMLYDSLPYVSAMTNSTLWSGNTCSFDHIIRSALTTGQCWQWRNNHYNKGSRCTKFRSSKMSGAHVFQRKTFSRTFGHPRILKICSSVFSALETSELKVLLSHGLPSTAWLH